MKSDSMPMYNNNALKRSQSFIKRSEIVIIYGTSYPLSAQTDTYFVASHHFYPTHEKRKKREIVFFIQFFVYLKT